MQGIRFRISIQFISDLKVTVAVIIGARAFDVTIVVSAIGTKGLSQILILLHPPCGTLASEH